MHVNSPLNFELKHILGIKCIDGHSEKLGKLKNLESLKLGNKFKEQATNFC